MILGFLDELSQNPPHYLVDTQNPITPIWELPYSTPRIAKKVEYLKSHFHPLKFIGNWVIYIWNP
ncbi:hypothetical protein D6779_07610 [Candidatus Parcubacteria bacterium]|nr:MAG: hypothetical protein D6779_07610 [Candidatus Parcubacteria bacterium]